MDKKKRRGGYLATAEGVKQLKEAKRVKKYTYQQIAEAANETEDKVKRLFNPQWGNGNYKIGEEAVEAICNILDLKPEEIINDWYESETTSKPLNKAVTKIEASLEHKISNSELLKKIEQVANNRVQTLELSGIKLVKLPSEIEKLSNLTVLDLSNNSLTTLPSEIGKLAHLRYLDLSNNSLTTLPSEIGKLANLRYLNLSNNSLTTLPSEIQGQSKLTILNLRHNLLGSLPIEIEQLFNLKELYLDNNSLLIPPEILEKNNEPETIINYYISLQSNQKKPLHEAKMLLVGQGNVGKTCLREKLIRNLYDPKRNKTNGIDIESWEIKIDEKKLQVNIWDFGGQEIMHSTHQFFLTKRSLYLLVVDNTIGEEENRIEYWLKIIQSFGKNSPVVIVGNKVDQHPLDIDTTGLKQKYPQIIAFLEVSCKNGKGISELTTVIKAQISQLDHIDDELPLPWFNVKQKLETLKDAKNMDYISYDKYESICKAVGVKKENNQHILIQFLHDLGIVLNFKDDDRLSDTHVLNPEWVTNGVYKILNDYQLIVEHKGILKRDILSRILDERKYPRNKHLFIIDMMRKFELCFDIEADKQFLIPDILPKEEPYTGEWENTLIFEYHYLVLPGSIISRFIVRMSDKIYKKTYWRNGVVLFLEGNIALVKADKEDKKVTIKVDGNYNTKRNLLTAIRSQFDYIHQAIPGITPVEKVPFIEHPEIVLDYQELIGLEEMGETDVVIGKLKRRIPLKQFLDGIETTRTRNNKQFSKNID